MNILQKLKNIGPGILVTAAFIGPGTITACTLSGAGFGYALLWGLVFSVFATIILQEMTARLGIIGRRGLGEALRQQFEAKIARYIAVFLVLFAILFGNAAYETGNILGASLGMIELTGFSEINFGGFSIAVWGPIIGIIAFILMMMGSYKSLERILIVLVVLMSIAFITTMFIIGPELISVLKGMFVPSIPSGGVFMLIALIGTTVVPYNLFLHASVVQEKWKTKADLKLARTDIIFSIVLGGLVSMSIVITSAVAFYGTNASISGASDLASQLKPLLGNWAGIFMAIGLFAAGISSAITAPLAAAYATSGILGLKNDMKSWHFKFVWMLILFIGIVFSALKLNPIEVISWAQFANGLLLPVIAVYLLLIMNSKKILGDFTNKPLQNVIGFIVVLVMLGLGIKSIFFVFVNWGIL